MKRQRGWTSTGKKQSELRNTCGKPSPTHLSYKLITQGSSRKAALFEDSMGRRLALKPGN